VVRQHALRPLAERLGLIAAWRTIRGLDPVDPRASFADDPSWSSALNPDFARRADAWRAAPEPLVSNARLHHWQMIVRPLMYRTMELMDRASSLWSVESRYPFMDKRLIEYCLALPADQKLSKGWTRVVMRRGLKGILPEPIRMRSSKADHSHGFREGLVKFERDRLEALHRERPGGLDRFVQPAFLERVGGTFDAGPPGVFAKQVLWRSLTLGLWLEHERAEAGSS
jgi:asparagine synthase (glutamine-hydrolysing)